jgi:hypothetical protein
MRPIPASLVLSLMLALPGMAQDKKPLGRDELKRFQKTLTEYFVPRAVKTTQDLPYVERAVVIANSSVSVQPVSPEDKAEEYYGKAGSWFKIRRVDLKTKEVIFTLYPVYLDARRLPTPPINPNDPPFEPQQMPIPKNRGGIAGVFKRPTVQLTVVVEYASPDELNADKLEVRLKQLFEIENSARRDHDQKKYADHR